MPMQAWGNLVAVPVENGEDIVCTACGQRVGHHPDDYLANYPLAADEHLQQLNDEHRDHAPECYESEEGGHD